MAREPVGAEITPRWIKRNDELNFLHPEPTFDLFLSIDRLRHLVEALVVNQPIDFVFFAELRTSALLVLPDSAWKIVRHPDIESFGAIRHDVDKIVALAAHRA